MFEFITDDEERGQVGIGTLIVFIAMVLVAAIAAGVLINTAGFLQTKSEATGEESTAQVSNRVTVISGYGHVEVDGGTIKGVDTVNLTVMRAAGADNINLSRSTIEWIGPNEAKTLTFNGTYDHAPNNASGTADNDYTFNVWAINKASGDSSVITSQEDRLKILLNASAIEGDVTMGSAGTNLDPLGEGDEVQLKITTQFGATTTYYLTVPESLEDKNVVQL